MITAAGSRARPEDFRVHFMPTPRPIATLLKTLILVLCGLGLGTAHAAAADEVTELQRLYYAGQAGVAMQRADDYLASHPKDARVRFLKGVMLADAKRNTEAISVFQKLNEDYRTWPSPTTTWRRCTPLRGTTRGRAAAWNRHCGPIRRTRSRRKTSATSTRRWRHSRTRARSNSIPPTRRRRRSWR
jgi:hypothetical protein